MTQKRKLVTEFQKKMDQEKILALYREGKGIKAIAKALGTNHMSIKRTLIRLGVYHNPHQGPEVTTQGNNEVTEVTEDNQLCETSDSQSSLGKYQKDLCKNWESCPVCQLELGRYVQLRELYRLGAPSPVLCSYFNLTAKALAGHAFAKNWHKEKGRIEDPARRRVIRQMIEDETWKVVMESKSEGHAKDKLSGLKLLGEMEGLGTKEKDQPASIGRIINIRFSLNEGKEIMARIRENFGLSEEEIEGAAKLLPEPK